MCPPLLVFGPSFSFLAPPAAISWRRAWLHHWPKRINHAFSWYSPVCERRGLLMTAQLSDTNPCFGSRWNFSKRAFSFVDVLLNTSTQTYHDHWVNPRSVPWATNPVRYLKLRNAANCRHPGLVLSRFDRFRLIEPRATPTNQRKLALLLEASCV